MSLLGFSPSFRYARPIFSFVHTFLAKILIFLLKKRETMLYDLREIGSRM
jgi:hypothetical protein